MKEENVRDVIVEDVLEELEGCGIDNILVWLTDIAEFAKADKYYDVEFGIHTDGYYSKRMGLMGTRKVMAKTEEEIAELRKAIEERDVEEITDAIGDIFVTLVMQTQAWGLDMETCVEQAYKTISQRTGSMVDGKFVKDGD